MPVEEKYKKLLSFLVSKNYDSRIYKYIIELESGISDTNKSKYDEDEVFDDEDMLANMLDDEPPSGNELLD